MWDLRFDSQHGTLQDHRVITTSL